MADIKTLPKRWTYEEYYASTDEWETYEIIDGSAVAHGTQQGNSASGVAWQFDEVS